jgi:drug/metabolite transporter (DMT)-like permease
MKPFNHHRKAGICALIAVALLGLRQVGIPLPYSGIGAIVAVAMALFFAVRGVASPKESNAKGSAISYLLIIIVASILIVGILLVVFAARAHDAGTLAR